MNIYIYVEGRQTDAKKRKSVQDEEGKMLSSMMSTMSTTSTLSTMSTTSTLSTLSTTSVGSLFSIAGVPDTSIIAVVCLIALLAASEILSASKLWSKRPSTMLNLAIFPMVMAFLAIVCFNVMNVLK